LYLEQGVIALAVEGVDHCTYL